MSRYASYPSLDGAPVFITGGAAGIGEEIVRHFAAQGSKVGFIDLDGKNGTALQEELSDAGHSVRFEQCNLTDTPALREAFNALHTDLGAPLALVNNAGHDERHAWAEVTPDYYDERIAVNIKQKFFCIQTVAPWMVEARKGSIINFGSNSWFENFGGMPVYTSAKAGMHGMTRAFARELGEFGIRVNTLVPGWIITQRQKDLWLTDEALAHQLARQCIHEPLMPVNVARMALFLASDDSEMCSSNNYMVEAGSI